MPVPTPHPNALTPKLSVPDAAGCVLRQAFSQFTSNLEAMRTSTNPEFVHHARVGWRRFNSALRLFKPVLADAVLPPWDGLQPLLLGLGELRNLEVALRDTLPPLEDAYTAGDARRAAAWQVLTQALTQATQQQRKAVRAKLQQPTIRAALLASTQWLQALPTRGKSGATSAGAQGPLRPWARRRLAHLHHRLQTARKTAADADSQHRVRILAKRLRYGIEALGALLPQRRAQRWHRRALTLQTQLGAARDIAQASALIEQWAIDSGLIEFLRGVAVGQQGTPDHAPS